MELSSPLRKRLRGGTCKGEDVAKEKLCDVCGEPVAGRFKRHVTCAYNNEPKDLPLEEMIGGHLPDDLDLDLD